MAARLIDGNALADVWRRRIAADVTSLAGAGRRICLAGVLAGDDGGAKSYARAQAKSASALGIEHRLVELQASSSADRIAATIDGLNADDAVDGVLLYSPLPNGLDAFSLQQRIAPEKDVEGVSATNLGLLSMGREAPAPCTAAAAFECIRATGIDPAGREAVVVGRSAIVGRPIASLLLAAHATVIQCHSRTRNLAEQTRRGEILVVAAGRAGLIGVEHVRAGAVVIDVGTNRVPDGAGGSRIVGDVNPDVSGAASWLTPVPGGVGPLTVMMLLSNVVAAARRRHG